MTRCQRTIAISMSAAGAALARPSADGGTTFILPSGQRMAFAPGQVWVVLASAPRSATHG
jgi:hypothetical protein